MNKPLLKHIVNLMEAVLFKKVFLLPIKISWLHFVKERLSKVDRISLLTDDDIAQLSRIYRIEMKFLC